MDVIPRNIVEPNIVFDIFSVQRMNKIRVSVAIATVAPASNIVVSVSAAGETIFLVRQESGDKIDGIIRDGR